MKRTVEDCTKEWQRKLGFIGDEVDGKFGEDTLAASKALITPVIPGGVPHNGPTPAVATDDVHSVAPTIPAPPPGIEGRKLFPTGGIRLLALAAALSESKNWTKTSVPRSRVAVYLEHCSRTKDGADVEIGGWLISELNRGIGVHFCAAAIGWTERCAFYAITNAHEGLARPPHRAGALEMMRDSQEGRRPGERFVWISDVVRHRIYPPPGSIAFYENRSPTAAPRSGHVEQVIESDDRGYRSVGANEMSGRWHEDPSFISWDSAMRLQGVLQLIGFSVPA